MDYVVIEKALPDDLLQEIHRAMSAGPFDNGKDTAQGLARAMKSNLQLSQAVHAPLLDRIALAIKAHPGVEAFALPQKIGRPIINRYGVGMEYGMHVDQAYISEMRTDISFTLFLEDPASYDGGELLIFKHSQQIAFKLTAGSMVVYPTGALHRVTQVTRGTRNAVIGWMQSRIRNADQRSMINKLSAVKNAMSQDSQQLPLLLQTNECIQELIRMWGE